jgi:hypothetical protein
MSVDDNSKEQQVPQGVVVEIPEKSLPKKISYDVNLLREFIDVVFDTEHLEPDENILVWKSTGLQPGYPQTSVDKMLLELERATRPAKLYFGTSTVTRDPLEGLRNRKSLFKQFYVLVLDDIGTKVPLDTIPEGFTPTYKIETSQGNFQYGYVLAEPITVLEEATTLVQLVYDAGFSDTGGRMATKLVRLPAGVNGKRGDGENFPVTLTEWNPETLWEPQDILDQLGIGVLWSDVVTDSAEVLKRRKHGALSLTPWSPVPAQLPGLNGIIDEVAEWLFSKGMVKQETNDWLTVKCPWSDTHTSPGDWASYSPLGWGGSQYRHMRTFNCFHDHCRLRSSTDFLAYVSAEGGPAAPIRGHAIDLVSRYAYDSIENVVWDVTTRVAYPTPVQNLPWVYPDSEYVTTWDGKRKLMSEIALYKSAKSKVVVKGITYDPTTPAKIVTDAQGINRLNTYTEPDWGDGSYDKKDVAQFEAFIEYLVPDKKSREYFLNWLAAKTQDMAFRGPAVLMIAPKQGTGRSTLGNMLAEMFGAENVEKVPFHQLSNSGNFNEWLVRPIVLTDETFALGDDMNVFRVYERLKEIIDTTPTQITVNPKYGKQRRQITYTSYLMFSNHEDAMRVAGTDRRIYVLRNAEEPAAPEYFVKLHEWLDKGTWAKSVWRWLRQRKIDIGELVKPPEMTEAKEEMLFATQRPIDVAVKAVVDNWPTGLVASFQVKMVLTTFTQRLCVDDSNARERQIQKVFIQNTMSADGKKVRIGDKIVRVRITDRIKADVTHELTEENLQRLRAIVDAALTEHDF